MEPLTLISLFTIIFLVGLVFSMFGQGGGSFFVPVMIAFAIPFHDAASTSLFILMATSISAVWVYGRSRMIDWKLALIIDPITDIMAFISGYFAINISGSLLKVLFALVLILSSYFMIKPVKEDKTLLKPKKRFGWWHRKFGDYEYDANLLVAIPLSGIAGILAGLLGISCGLFKVPLLVLLCGVPMKIAVATSSFMVALTGLGGFLGHSLSETINWKLAITLSIAAFLGAQIGSRISIKMNKILLKKLFGVLLILISIWMIYNALTA
ncbi:MAG: sulfite exporter TauE/SafE family protein [Candidatus Omnitrophota bacterium]|nr:MAG: sulfite exporter TauE/SafE family protein [Candidatus Omnitrophota bacterium]